MSLVPADYDSSSEEEPRSTGEAANHLAGAGTGHSRNVTFLNSTGTSVEQQPVQVILHELLDPDYGSYLWPSALVLSAFVYWNAGRFFNKQVLEVGCGTALPGLLAAKLGAKRVVLSDLPDAEHLLKNAQHAVHANQVDDVCSVIGLRWGKFPPLSDPSYLFDFILGADVFYEPRDFDDLIASVAYMLSQSRPSAKFITAYQERSSRRTVQPLLEKWNLRCRIVDKRRFGGWGEAWRVDGKEQVPREIGSVALLIIERAAGCI
ncbi:hypothetical protein SpCBS45565_g04917 [Spizellomyces sp. 'palustris']|nr:hypothetical protein SpCBS45565_g04917 [Spizellomyces sp. 'palustris']